MDSSQWSWLVGWLVWFGLVWFGLVWFGLVGWLVGWFVGWLVKGKCVSISFIN
jgi:hypothetical protein